MCAGDSASLILVVGGGEIKDRLSTRIGSSGSGFVKRVLVLVLGPDVRLRLGLGFGISRDRLDPSDARHLLDLVDT